MRTVKAKEYDCLFVGYGPVMSRVIIQCDDTWEILFETADYVLLTRDRVDIQVSREYYEKMFIENKG